MPPFMLLDILPVLYLFPSTILRTSKCYNTSVLEYSLVSVPNMQQWAKFFHVQKRSVLVIYFNCRQGGRMMCKSKTTRHKLENLRILNDHADNKRGTLQSKHVNMLINPSQDKDVQNGGIAAARRNEP
jgi:hypothetical protein